MTSSPVQKSYRDYIQVLHFDVKERLDRETKATNMASKVRRWMRQRFSDLEKQVNNSCANSDDEDQRATAKDELIEELM